ncbi:M23 family metallopeptidase [Mangrovicoccus algicola]|uniref:M23 family metallopeptidase n=1 Tax=Mangrovicoccus algicola TaxID=2771008 RepID=A0A8J6Z1R1_9RHOB|nr:M23 family metallopeptidase [Mangrovicoccus algicola]MBE3640088.1 M23 family metallopeptidase [Mangrovicoccus algicola]
MRVKGILAAVMAAAVTAAPGMADVMEEGAAVVADFLAGEDAGLWARMTPEMQAALGGPERLADLRGALRDSHGAESEILSEQVAAQGGYEVYSRVSRWEGDPAPLGVTVAFDGASRIAGFLIRPQPVAAQSRFLDYRTKADLRLPVEGAWHVFWGGRDIADNYHAVDPGQRFAMDLLVLRNGASHAGDPARNESYHCWDRPILAPAAGRVAAAADGLPDQSPGEMNPQAPLGNHVILDLGNGEYAFLAHLRQGSVAVAGGQEVAAGDLLGRCGNSGNSSEPHLHVHLQTSPDLGEGDGLPAQFRDYLADGAPVDRGEPLRGQEIAPRPPGP